ncbi:DUF3347 domain-containing protein [Aquimarina sp. MMG016]|uniref:DUF3347 domain-containing protein n=1 Tax=Aquimarina sp. MMG016 TaxID=2822690 RepID=UPI001B39E66C|nr:DUF3347 domain-containing protein [Aquimarina sp. MMG016]MBQ4820800.1 DUF3347 domain-containing protein [Aquimarina sp. MMG016]
MKKVIIKTIILTVISTVVFSCGKDKKTPEVVSDDNEVEEVSKVDLNHTDSRSDVVFADTSVTKIYHQYLNIKKALVNANNEMARTAAKSLAESISEEESNKQLKATAKLVSLTKDLKKQRDFLVTLTSEVEKLITNAEITSGEVHKQFCPMAFEGEGGYWLSDSKEVRNPYFGNKMLKCGSVKATIQ